MRDQNGETITYKGDREMAAALAALDREIAQATGRAAPTTLRFRTSKGT
ncbi:MAG: phage head-tail joining protein [Tropicimonas sp.]